MLDPFSFFLCHSQETQERKLFWLGEDISAGGIICHKPCSLWWSWLSSGLWAVCSVGERDARAAGAYCWVTVSPLISLGCRLAEDMFLLSGASRLCCQPASKTGYCQELLNLLLLQTVALGGSFYSGWEQILHLVELSLCCAKVKSVCCKICFVHKYWNPKFWWSFHSFHGLLYSSYDHGSFKAKGQMQLLLSK